MLRYYGVDLLDRFRGSLSARRLRVLIQHLPREAALVRALHGEKADWGMTEHLLAATVDELAIGNWLYATVHAPEHASAPERPRPVPRPGDDGEIEMPAATTAQIARFFGRR